MLQTTIATTKWQITIPKVVRDKIGLKRGAKVDIYPTEDGFIGKIRRQSRILEFAGDLAKLDKNEPISEIREKAFVAAFKDKYAPK